MDGREHGLKSVQTLNSTLNVDCIQDAITPTVSRAQYMLNPDFLAMKDPIGCTTVLQTCWFFVPGLNSADEASTSQQSSSRLDHWNSLPTHLRSTSISHG